MPAPGARNGRAVNSGVPCSVSLRVATSRSARPASRSLARAAASVERSAVVRSSSVVTAPTAFWRSASFASRRGVSAARSAAKSRVAGAHVGLCLLHPLLDGGLHGGLQLSRLRARNVLRAGGHRWCCGGARRLLRLLDVLRLLIELAHGAHLIGDVEPGGAEPERAA